MKNYFSIVLLLLCLSVTAKAQIDIMKGFKLGKYNVGFKYSLLEDSSRSYDNGKRQIPLYIWYPTTDSLKQPIHYSEYYSIVDNSFNDENLRQFVSSRIEDSTFRGNFDEVYNNFKNLKTIALKDATMIDKKFPVIMLAPGGNTPGHLHSVIAEYLASYGFIVSAFPTISNSDTLRWPFDQSGLMLFVEDMEFCIDYLIKEMIQIDTEKIGLMSWSVGGVAQAMLCSKNPTVNMLISLDSGLGRDYGVTMYENSPFYDYSKLTVPYLHLTGAAKEMYDVPRSTEFLDSIVSQNKFIHIIDNLAHQHFASSIGIIPELISNDKDSSLIESYIEVCDITHNFIKVYLLNERDSKDLWIESYK